MKLMKWFFALTCTGLLSSPLFGRTLDIRQVNHGGSACPQGSASVQAYDSDFDGTDDAFQVIYDAFVVERPGEPAVKNCLISVTVNIPSGYQYSIFQVESVGYADIHEYHEGRLDMEYSFPFAGRWTATARLTGPYVRRFDVYSDFPAASWSPCNRNVPLSLNTRASIRRKQNVFSDTGAYSVMQVEQQNARFVQYYYVTWRSC